MTDGSKDWNNPDIEANNEQIVELFEKLLTEALDEVAPMKFLRSNLTTNLT